MNTYKTWVPVAYPPDDKGMPVPGWDMRRRMAGSPIIAIGATPSSGTQRGIIIHASQAIPSAIQQKAIQGTQQKALYGLGMDMTIQTPLGPQKVSIPIEGVLDQAIGSAVEKAWPQIQPKMHAELKSAAEEMQKTMRRDMIIAAAAMIGAMVLIEMIEWKKLKV